MQYWRSYTSFSRASTVRAAQRLFNFGGGPATLYFLAATVDTLEQILTNYHTFRGDFAQFDGMDASLFTSNCQQNISQL
jgi:hypothetical protein